jgi:type II secretory pathway predicted ATPase ExeA
MTPEARLFFASSQHARAYAHLLYGIAQREGFVVVTGEVGAGKTTLVERLCAELDPGGFAVARISTTQVGGDDLLRLAADAFGAQAEGDKSLVLRSLTAMLRRGGRRFLLIVDEAQALTPAGLEELRMLSNVTEGGQAPLQTVLLGQPQLRETLASPDLDQLRQRVLACYHLGALTREETHAYVVHRMRAVGWDGTPRWETPALDHVHRHSGGIPRRINRLCSRVLLGGLLEQAMVLTEELVDATAIELEEDLGGGRPAPRVAPEMIPEPTPHMAAGPAAPPEDSPPPAPAGELNDRLVDVQRRVQCLEWRADRRRRVLGKVVEMFSDHRRPR